MKTKILWNIVLSFWAFMGISQSCLPNGITLSTQNEIDNFPQNYPGCTEILGLLIISDINSSDANVDSLKQLTKVGGGIIINQGIYSLDMEGLKNLTEIGGQLYINMNSFDGIPLENLESINGKFHVDSGFGAFEGLNNLAYIGGDFLLEWLFL